MLERHGVWPRYLGAARGTNRREEFKYTRQVWYSLNDRWHSQTFQLLLDLHEVCMLDAVWLYPSSHGPSLQLTSWRTQIILRNERTVCYRFS